MRFLRVGAVGLGLGAAATVGHGTAAAAPDDTSHASSDHGSSATGSKHAHAAPRTTHPTKPDAAPASGSDVANPGHATPPPGSTRKLTRTHAPTPTALLNATTVSGSVPSAPVASPTPTAAPSAATSVRISVKRAPVTVKTVVTDVLSWIGLRQSASDLPLPASPVGPLFAAVWGVARELESSINYRRSTARSTVTTTLSTGESPSAPDDLAAAPATAIAAATTAGSARAAAALTETEQEQADAAFNMSVGWVPVVGTVYNAISLVSDFLQFSTAILNGNPADMGDEIGDMTIDVIGMIPIVGGPLAANIRWAVLAASTPPDHAPSPVDDTFTTNEDTPLTDNVLTNDTDADGDPLTAALKTGPTHGAVTLNADGSFTYSPTADYNGVDLFTYTVSDGVKSKTGKVTVTINPVNDTPVAADDTATLDEDTSAAIPVLANDTDVDQDPLSVVGATAPGHGTASLTGDGTITYTPTANYNGVDLFTYTVSDGHGGTSTATVTVTIDPVNDAPTAVNDSFTVTENTTLTANVVANDTDVDGNPLTVTDTTTPGHGTTAITGGGTITYTPTANYTGTDSFAYTVTDGQGGTSTATVSVTVNPANHPPKAVTDSFTTNENTKLTGNVLTNDTDPDGNTLTAALKSNAAHGGVSVNSNGSFTYNPASNYSGTDSFTYTVSDGHGGTAVGTANITVKYVAPPASAPLSWPLKGAVVINQTWGVNPTLYAQYGQKGHNGLDLKANSGTPVYAAANGVIAFEGYGQNNSWMGSAAGICVLIKHSSLGMAYDRLQAHLSSTTTTVNRAN